MGKAVPLSEATFVVVDIESTGSIPGKDAVLEISAVRVRGGQIIDRFESLVNPQQEIPPFIQQLTGITPEMVQDAPSIETVMPGFWEFLGEDVFVAHHVPFDFRFLTRVTQDLLGQPLDNPQLCTCRLARKLLPGLRRKNLDSVTQHFDITIKERHRAMGDAEATALVLIEFLKMLETEGATTLAKVMSFQKSGNKRYSQFKIPFPEHRVADFPQHPGVYVMRDEKGEILYIGKAKNLRKRLRSYFSNLYNQPAKVQELMQQVIDIETRVLGSDLEALLEESYLIKYHQPYYNRQIKNYKSFPFLKVTTQDAFPRLSVTTEIESDDALYFGPYQRKRHLTAMVESLSKVFQLRSCSDAVLKKHQNYNFPCMAYEIQTCSGPCAGKASLDEYRGQVQAIVDFLEGRVSDLTRRMMEQRDKYAEAMEFEKAQRIQDRLLELLKLQANTRYLAQAVHQNHALIVLPDREPDRYWLLYVFKGRPFFKQVFDPSTDSVESILERVTWIQRLLSMQLEDKPETIEQRELEEIRIIAHWLKDPEPEAQIWDLTEPFKTLSSKIKRAFGQNTPDLKLVWPEPVAEEVFPEVIEF